MWCGVPARARACVTSTFCCVCILYFRAAHNFGYNIHEINKWCAQHMLTRARLLQTAPQSNTKCTIFVSLCAHIINCMCVYAYVYREWNHTNYTTLCAIYEMFAPGYFCKNIHITIVYEKIRTACQGWTILWSIYYILYRYIVKIKRVI